MTEPLQLMSRSPMTTPLGRLNCVTAFACRRALSARRKVVMPSRIEQLQSRRLAIRSDLDALEALEDPSEEDALRSEALTQEWDSVDEEFQPLFTLQPNINIWPQQT